MMDRYTQIEKDVEYSLPPGWAWAPFSEVVETIPLTGRKLKQSDYLPEGDLPVIDQGQVYIGGRTDRHDFKVKIEQPVVVFGDHTKVLKYVNFDFVAGADGVKVLKPENCFEPKFFFYLLHTIELPEKGYARHFQFLQKTSLPLPPLPEQRHIVAKIEELFTKLDAGVEALKKAKAELKRYRQAVLKYAFEGKLTAEWRKSHIPPLTSGIARMAAEPIVPYVASLQRSEMDNQQSEIRFEPASVLLERIRQERRRMMGLREGKGRAKQLLLIDTFDLPDASTSLSTGLPEGWVWTTLGEACEVILGQSPPSSTYNESGKGLPFFQGSAEFGDVYPTIRKWCTATKKIAEKGDILISVRAPVGPTNIAQVTSSVGRGLAAIRPLGCIPNSFLLYFLRSIVNEIARRGTGTTFQAITGDKLRGIEIPLPPLAEQQQIVAEIELRFSVTNQIELVVDQSLKQAERLRQSILKKAFEGKLVPQDPSDPPASTLLEQISEAKEQQKRETEARPKKKRIPKRTSAKKQADR